MDDRGEAYDKIEAYLSGELTGSELAAFSDRLESDPTFRAEVDLHRELAETFQPDPAYERAQAMVREVGAQAARAAPSSPSLIRKLPSWALALAATILLAIGAFFIFRPASTPNTNGLFAEYFVAYPMDVFRGEPAVDDPIAGAISAYQKGDYPAAVQLFERVDPLPEDWTFYYGLAQLGAGAGSAAAATLERLETLPGFSNLQQPIQWYTALAWLQAGSVEKATAQLRQIAEDEQHYQRQQAQALLQKL